MKNPILPFLFAAAFCTALGGCGDDETAPPSASDVGVDAPSDTSEPSDVTPDVEVDAAPDTPAEPSGPDLRAYTGGACPLLGAGANTLESSSVQRSVELFLPEEVEFAPLVFFWYGAGGSTVSYDWMQDFADAYGVVIAVPGATSGLFEWPILAGNDPSPELVFFDDILACTAESLPIDTRRIYTTGFSAGGIWSSVLVMHRSDVLAAAAIYSGGTGSLVRPYESPSAQIPILGMYGGDSDIYGGGIMNFKDSMSEFMDGLVGDGHLVVACNHDGGHTIPAGGLGWGLDFVRVHRFGDVESPYETELPPYLPEYCSYWE